MRYLLIALLLTGCSTLVPVKANFPELPQAISEACPDLEKLPADTKKLTDVVSNVSKNYSTYYECQAKQEAVAEWYKAQKQIFETVK
jgi:hypothetical protein